MICVDDLEWTELRANIKEGVLVSLVGVYDTMRFLIPSLMDYGEHP